MEIANDLYRTILTNGPSPSTLLIILQRMKQEGRIREVVPECIKGLRLYPGDIRLRWLLAECYLELGFFSMAEKEIVLAARNIEKLMPVFRFQADLFQRQGRVEDASAALQKYLAHFPEDTEAVERLEGLREKGKTPPSQDTITEEIFPDIVTHTLAEIYENQGEFQAAIETYKKLLEQAPGDPRAKERLEQLQAKIDRKEKIPEAPRFEKDGKEKIIRILERWLVRMEEMTSD